MITKEDVLKIAELSKIEIKEEDIEKIQGDFSSILEYVGQLSELDTSGAEEMVNITGLKNIEREDIPQENNPFTKGEYLEVKKVLHHD
jgi:aspartyl-tRNA(Asn)/glutamyl-tRNA(Gln) amidotransferase subunit C